MKLGLGCWPLGSDAYGTVTDRDAKALLTLAESQGISFFDTSPTYGNGHSEMQIGRFLPNKEKVLIATKVGMLPHQGTEITYDFSAKSMISSLLESKRRLQLDSLPLVQLHSPPPESLSLSLLKTLQVVMSSVPVRAWGISLNSPRDIEWALELNNWSYIQFNFSLLDQRVLDYAPLLNNREFKSIARTPFNFGFLTRDFNLNSALSTKNHQLNRWNKEQLMHWWKESKMIGELAEEAGRHVDELALRFVLDSPEIDFVIPGAVSRTDVRRNLNTTISTPLSDDLMNRLRAVRDVEVKKENYPYSFKIN